MADRHSLSAASAATVSERVRIRGEVRDAARVPAQNAAAMASRAASASALGSISATDRASVR